MHDYITAVCMTTCLPFHSCVSAIYIGTCLLCVSCLYWYVRCLHCCMLSVYAAKCVLLHCCMLAVCMAVCIMVCVCEYNNWLLYVRRDFHQFNTLLVMTFINVILCSSWRSSVEQIKAVTRMFSDIAALDFHLYVPTNDSSISSCLYTLSSVLVRHCRIGKLHSVSSCTSLFPDSFLHFGAQFEQLATM